MHDMQIKICRACLCLDNNVKESSDELLNVFYQAICDEKIEENGAVNMLLGLCVYCSATVLKVRDFRKRCLEAARTLNTLMAQGEVHYDNLEKICKTKCASRYTTADVFNFNCQNDDEKKTNKRKAKHKNITKKKQVEDKTKEQSNVIFVYENDFELKTESDVLENSNLNKENVLNRLSVDGASVGDVAACKIKQNFCADDLSIKFEIGDVSDGFDSEDDRALTALDTSSKDQQKDIRNKKFHHRTTQKQRKRLKTLDGRRPNGKLRKVKLKEECVEAEESVRTDELDVRIKKEEVEWEEVANDETNIDNTNNDKLWRRRVRPIYYRFDESTVQLIKQSAEEIHKELQRSREATGYQSAPYKCHPCAKYFMTDISLALHSERHSQKAGPMMCEICTQRYTNHRSLSIHNQTHTDRYRCAYVGPDRIQKNVAANEESETQREEGDSGRVCGRMFAARSAAVKHALKHTGNQMLFHCHLCGKTTNCANTHQKHVRAHTVVKKHACPQCNKEFNNSTTRNLHVMRAHTGVRHFSCPSCPMTFVNKTALVAHSVKHSSHREFYCVECDMYFKSASILKCHLTTSVKHSDPNTFKFQCSMCPRRYPLLYRLRDHVESAHARRGHCVCDVCGATYHTGAALRRHHRQKHEDTPRERKHTCLVCDKAFLTRQTLASHKLTHTGERPYPCQLCGKLFRHKAALWTHNKLVHNKNKASRNTTQD